MTDADLDVRFKQICCEFGLSWFEPIDGDSAQFPIDRVAADLIETLTTAYDSETAAMIERELAEYHRHQICLPGFDGCKPDVELLAPQIMAEREAALYE